MKVGVLTWYMCKFEEIQFNNRDWDCYHLRNVSDLVGVTFDMFIRLDGWHKLDPDLLNTVHVQEKIRDLNKSKVKEENTASKRITRQAQNRFQTGGYVGLDMAQTEFTKAWGNATLFFPDKHHVSTNNNDLVDSLKGVGKSMKRATLEFSNMYLQQPVIRINEKDLPFIINKDDIEGMP